MTLDLDSEKIYMRIPKIFCPILKHIRENKLFWSSMTWFILKNGEIMPYFKSQKPFRLLHLRVHSKFDCKFQLWPKIHVNLNKTFLDNQKDCYIRPAHVKTWHLEKSWDLVIFALIFSEFGYVPDFFYVPHFFLSFFEKSNFYVVKNTSTKLDT